MMMSQHMSEVSKAEVLCCASCGIAEVDDIKLVPCDGCDLVCYCSDECREEHKSEHKEACKERAAELREELLFKQPESTHWGDCPICMIPLPIDVDKCTISGCCSKVICQGCARANWIREIEMRIQRTCPFCREPWPETEEEWDEQRMKRVEANDPVALYQQGGRQNKKGEYQSAFEYWTKAAELGNAEAHFQLSNLYDDGKVVEKDEGKMSYHGEEAAIAGHPLARHNLGFDEMNNGNPERAIKHYIIAATQGEDRSIKSLMKLYKKGFLVSKEDLASSLRAHKAAVDAMNSSQRKEAEK